MTKTYNITGMKCQGCVNTVTEKLSAVKGVDKVQVDLETNKSLLKGNLGNGLSNVPLKALSSSLVTKFKTGMKQLLGCFFAYNLFENPFLL